MSQQLKIFQKVYLFLGLIGLNNVCFAGPKMITEVEKIRVRPHVAYVKLVGCPKYNRVYLDSEYGKAMLSSALTAATTKKAVQVEFTNEDGCQTSESTYIYFEVDFGRS